MKIFYILIAITLLFCPGAFAQTPPPGDVGPNVMFYQSAAVGPAGIVRVTRLPSTTTPSIV